MYKVFVNDKPIFLISSLPDKEDFPIYSFKDIVIEELLHKLKTNKLQGVYLYSYLIEKDWELFCAHFKVVVSAGGLLVNSKKELLFIFRGNKWDLPKGHIEKGETKEVAAVREVEEECGITNIVLGDFLLDTHHIYYQNEDVCLKKTHWFLMSSDYSGVLTPQLEEGITKVVFKDKKAVAKALLNSYGNIYLVYEAYKKIK